MRDPYVVLGVGRDVRKAYRGLAKQLHPDLNPGDALVEQKFKEVTAAYDLLSDPAKRARFDRGELDAQGNERTGRSRTRSGGTRARPGAAGSAGAGFGREGFSGFSAEDIFNEFFRDQEEEAQGPFRKRSASGGGTRRGPESKGADVTYAITVSFVEAVRGAKRRVALTSGKSIEINIPAGTEEGNKLRLKGQGTGGFGGAPAGDAIVEVHVEPHPYFTRNGNDVHVTVPITLQEAVLGGPIEVPTIDGKVALRIPKGANTGTKLRLKGKGIEDAKAELRGDQYVTLQVVLPDSPDADLVAFIEGWARGHDYDVRKKSGMV
jgi:DnaJ-class molecular chaperone